MKAPDAIALPDPATRFARTAARLRILAAGHEMGKWLDFVSRLSEAQHRAACDLSPEPIHDAVVDQAVAARLPPLAADGHRRDPIWRGSFAIFRDRLDQGDTPAPARRAIAELCVAEATPIERLADTFLHGTIAPPDAGSALYVAAALQVYFTSMAARLPASSLRLLEQRGLCPSCGSTPSAGMVAASGHTPGARYLYCSLCSTAWNHVRAICITCGASRSISLEGIDGDDGLVKAETCGTCRTYAKMIYQKQDTKADPFADDLGSLGLDLLVGKAGWSRHAPNPWLLLG